MTGDLFLCTTLQRDGTDYDVVVYFKVTSYSPGQPAVMYQRNGDPGWPADPEEWEFEYLRAEFDGGEPADAPGPITGIEEAALMDWFDENYDLACEVAAEQRHDHGPDPDAEYDRRRDEQMERAR